MRSTSRAASVRRHLTLPLLLVALATLLAACGSSDDDSADSQTAAEQPSEGTAGEIELADVATGLEVPWGIDFLPDGDALVTERDSGRILRLDPSSGETTEEQTIEVDADGEGGLLGIAVSPDYENDNLVYAYYTTAEDNRIARFELGSEPEPIVTGIEASGIHNGGRLAFGPDGMLYASTGDAGDGSRAQDQDSLNGKILRMTPAGKAPADNPFNGSLVYSLGHRNVQGLAWDADGQLYATEFGESEFDEVNRIEAGANYGWPEVEGEGGEPDFTDPITTWSPSEASPAGAVIVPQDAATAERFGGELLVATLAGARLWQLTLDGGEVAGREQLLTDELGRLRTIVTTPAGELWLATSNTDGRGSPNDGDDRIVRLEAG